MKYSDTLWLGWNEFGWFILGGVFVVSIWGYSILIAVDDIAGVDQTERIR